MLINLIHGSPEKYITLLYQKYIFFKLSFF